MYVVCVLIVALTGLVNLGELFNFSKVPVSVFLIHNMGMMLLIEQNYWKEELDNILKHGACWASFLKMQTTAIINEKKLNECNNQY